MDINNVNPAQQAAEVTQAVMQAQLQSAALAEKMGKIAAQQKIEGVGEKLDVTR